MPYRRDRHTSSSTQKRRGLLYGSLGCCGCGGAGVFLLFMIGIVGSLMSPTPATVAAPSPTTAVTSAPPSPAPTTSPAATQPPTTEPPTTEPPTTPPPTTEPPVTTAPPTPPPTTQAAEAVVQADSDVDDEAATKPRGLVDTGASRRTPETTEAERPAETETPAVDEGTSAYYANCSEAKEAGAAPLHVGEPGYRKKLDRDGDGVACES